MSDLPRVGYWRDDIGGRLVPAMLDYLHHRPLSDEQCATLRAYFRQWMACPWLGAQLDQLRAEVDGLTSRDAIARWLDRAAAAGIDPL